MKNLIAGLLFLTIAGCSVYGDYVFDSTEYYQYSRILSTAQLSKPSCDNQVIMNGTVLPDLEVQARTLVTYTKHRGNIESQKAAAIINNFVVEMKVAYMKTPPPSKTYCELKLDVIVQGADRVLSSLGKL